MDITLGLEGNNNSSNSNKPIDSLEDFIERLSKKELDSNIKNDIIKKISKFPEGALGYAWVNIDNLIKQTIKKRAMNEVH